MPLLTYDSLNLGQDEIEALTSGELPDEVECGENNKHWIVAVRSKREMRLVSKIDGSVFRAVLVDRDFDHIAGSYGIGERQRGAVRDALKLGAGKGA